MAPSYSDYEDYKGKLDSVKNGVSKLSEMTKEANTLAEEGKTLSKVQGVLQGFTKWGEISAIFTVASVGLSIAQAIAGGDTPDEQILKKIGEVTTQIGKLSDHVDGLFAKLGEHLELNSAKEELSPAWGRIQDLRGFIHDYLDSTHNGGDGSGVAEEILMDAFKLSDPRLLANAIQRQCKGDGIVINLLQSTYDFTDGDMSAIVDIGTACMEAVLTCALGESIIASLQFRNGTLEKQISAEETNHFFQPMNDEIHELIQFWLEKSKRELLDLPVQSAETNLGRFLAAQFPTLVIATPLTDTAATLGKLLQKRWFCFDWVTLVYAAVEGWDNHGFSSGRTASYLRQPCKDGVQVNIIVHWDAPSIEKLMNAAWQLAEMSQLAEATFSYENDTSYQESLPSGYTCWKINDCRQLLELWFKGQIDYYYFRDCTGSTAHQMRNGVPYSMQQMKKAYGDAVETDLANGRVHNFNAANPIQGAPFLSIVGAGTNLGVWAHDRARVLRIAPDATFVSDDPQLPDANQNFSAQMAPLAEGARRWNYIYMHQGNDFLLDRNYLLDLPLSHWSYRSSGSEHEFDFNHYSLDNLWAKVEWDAISGKNMLRVRDISTPGTVRVSLWTFDSPDHFTGTDFDGQTPIEGFRKE